VPVAYRSQIPQVPACIRCNRDKSDLEHYLTAVLLFGGRHANATRIYPPEFDRFENVRVDAFRLNLQLDPAASRFDTRRSDGERIADRPASGGSPL
jgi:hypothetical protein